jgi:hypothetical protein
LFHYSRCLRFDVNILLISRCLKRSILLL